MIFQAIGAGLSIASGIGGKRAQRTASKKQAEAARYQAEVANNNLDFEHSLREKETLLQVETLNAQYSAQMLESAASRWRADYEYDAQKVETTLSRQAQSRALALRVGEFRRQQKALISNAERQISDVNRAATEGKTARIEAFIRDAGRSRAMFGDGTSTSAQRTTRELTYFKGVDMARLEYNRQNVSQALAQEAFDQVASVEAGINVDIEDTVARLTSEAMSLNMAKARRDATLSIQDKQDALNFDMRDRNISFADEVLEAQKVYLEYAKKANAEGAEKQAGAITAVGRAQGFNALMGGLSGAVNIAMNAYRINNSTIMRQT